MGGNVILPSVDHRVFSRRLDGWIGSRSFYGPGDTFTPRAQREWWLYFIQGDDGGPVKIGRTTNLLARLPELQCGYPFGRLRYVGIRRGLRDDEKHVHAQFAHLRLQGEWFRPSPELIDFIRAIPTEDA